MSSYLVAIDIGGTFTDMAAVDAVSGRVHSAKSLTTYGNLFAAIDDCVAARGLDLRDATNFKHGTTLVINSLIERHGARTALVTTRGFRDVLEIGRGNRPQPFLLGFARDRLLVERDMRFEIGERMAPDGATLEPPDADEVARLADRLAGLSVEAVAVSFLNSYASPRHEQQVTNWLRKLLPGAFVCCGSELTREWYEYERSATAAANAYVGPQVGRYVGGLGQVLDQRGFTGTRYFMGSGTGVLSLAQAAAQPVRLVESGPVGGLIGASAYAKALGIAKLVAFDVGGTTAKCALVQNGGIDVKGIYWVGGYERGFPIRSPIVDIVEVGAGGGSIAQVDESGRLRVGPRSAGSTPGPVAYGRGGTQPTVTDANVVLGRIAPQQFVGSSVKLDPVAARDAIAQQLAQPLGLSGEAAVDELASGVLAIASVVMAGAIRKITIERGEDPRDYVLFAYGGGGPLHSVELARELNIPQVVVPPHAGIFSAVGMLYSNVESDASRTYRVPLTQGGMQAMMPLWHELEADASSGLGELSDAPDRRFSRFADLRYRGQMHTLRVELRAGDDDSRMRERFEVAYAARFGHAQHGNALEIVSLFVRASVPDAMGALQPLEVAQAPAAQPVGTRRVFLSRQRRWAVLPVYQRADLMPGFTTQGPLVIEDYGSTCLADEGDVVRVGAFGEIRIELAAAREAAQ